jgi:repressor LexA
MAARVRVGRLLQGRRGRFATQIYTFEFYVVYDWLVPLTAKQAAFRSLLESLVVNQEMAPTLRELCLAAGFSSTRSAVQYLDALEHAGIISRGPGARNLRILRRIEQEAIGSAETVQIPVIGRIAAGNPILAKENILDYRAVANTFLRPGFQHFLLEVRGDSMDRAGIGDGDLVLVRQQTTASNGDRVVALVDQDATVKRLRIGAEAALLEPVSSNPVHKPIVIRQGFRIQGIVIASLPRPST